MFSLYKYSTMKNPRFDWNFRYLVKESEGTGTQSQKEKKLWAFPIHEWPNTRIGQRELCPGFSDLILKARTYPHLPGKLNSFILLYNPWTRMKFPSLPLGLTNHLVGFDTSTTFVFLTLRHSSVSLRKRYWFWHSVDYGRYPSIYWRIWEKWGYFSHYPEQRSQSLLPEEEGKRFKQLKIKRKISG